MKHNRSMKSQDLPAQERDIPLEEKIGKMRSFRTQRRPDEPGLLVSDPEEQGVAACN